MVKNVCFQEFEDEYENKIQKIRKWKIRLKKIWEGKIRKWRIRFKINMEGKIRKIIVKRIWEEN